MLSLSDLQTPNKRSDVMTWLLELLQEQGFQTTGWQIGRIQRAILYAVSVIGADLSEIVATIAGSAINEKASGVGLTLHSRSRFANERIAAVSTEGPMTLTSTATVPYPVQVGELLARDALGHVFRNTTGGTVPASGSLVLQWKATLAGSSGNVGNGTVTQLMKPMAGVTISNPGPGGSLPWYTVTGQDEESDADLQARNASKWATLSIEWVEAAYIYAARTMGARKVLIDATNPRGPGSVDVYLAADYSTYSDAEMLAFQQGFAARTFQTEDVWPPTDIPFPSHVYVKRPPEIALTLQGVVYYDPGRTLSDVQSSLDAALRDYLALTPIGGRNYSPGPTNVIALSDVVAVIEGVRGVRMATLTTPSGNVTVAPNALVTAPLSGWFGASALTFVAVTT